MPTWDILVLATALSLDAAAVSAARALGARSVEWRQPLLLALVFGVFQAVMLALGAGIGVAAGPWLERFDHWLAFVLLAGIGGKMLWEARHADQDQRAGWPGPSALLLLAVATSIDALAAGVGLATVDTPLASVIVSTGVITFLLSLLAGRFACRLGSHFGSRAEAVGGVVLIGLGLRILVTHLNA